MDATFSESISKPVYQAITSLTKEPRLDVALSLAVKDLIRLKLKETESTIKSFEDRHGMTFDAFKLAWHEGLIPNAHAYEIERAYWEWEAAVSDQTQLHKLQDNLL